jgi:AMP-binding enzyme C-terminal domain
MTIPYSQHASTLARKSLCLFSYYYLIHSLFSPRSKLCNCVCFCALARLYNTCRIGTAEIEAALASHPAVSEAAVVGFPDAIKGQGMCCYVSLVADAVDSPELIKELRLQVLELHSAEPLRSCKTQLSTLLLQFFLGCCAVCHW